MVMGRAMDLQKIKQLIDVLMASDLSELEFVEGEHRLHLVRRSRAASSGALAAGSLNPVVLPVAHVAQDAPSQALASGEETAAPVEPGELVTAPLYGILHLTPTPGAPPFVQPGEIVQRGQTLCVVEAMKMFHEVKAERSATVDSVFAAAGQEVEAGAALFRLVASG